MMGIPKKNYVAAILATSMCHLVEGPQKCRKCYTIFDHALSLSDMFLPYRVRRGYSGQGLFGTLAEFLIY